MLRILRPRSGFSIVELIVWIAIAGILVVAVTMLVGRSFSISRFQVEQARITDEARLHSERMAEDIRQAQYYDCNGDDDTEDYEDRWLRQAGSFLITFLANADEDGEIEQITYELNQSAQELTRTVQEIDSGAQTPGNRCVFAPGQAQKLTGFVVNGSSEALFSFFPAGRADSVSAFMPDPASNEISPNDLNAVVRVSLDMVVDVNPEQEPPAAQVGTDVTPRTVRLAAAPPPVPSPSLAPSTAPPSAGCQISPAIGPPGTEIEISGSSIQDVEKVFFHDNIETVPSGTSSPVIAKVPENATKGPILVKTSSGTITCPEFTPFLLEIENDSAIVFIIDHSGSTWDSFYGTMVGDVNGDLMQNSILDAEIASLINLNDALIEAGMGDEVEISVIQFDGLAQKLTIPPHAWPEVYFANPSDDRNGNGINDIEETLRRIQVAGGTDFRPPLVEALGLLQNNNMRDKSKFIIFLSDGAAGFNFQQEIYDLNQIVQEIRAIGVGTGSDMTNLRRIDPCVQRVSSTDALFAIFSGQTGTCDNPVPSLTCSPKHQTVLVNQFATVHAAQSQPGSHW